MPENTKARFAAGLRLGCRDSNPNKQFQRLLMRMQRHKIATGGKIRGIYHFRKITPVYLTQLIERSEISFSLRAEDRSRANELAERLNKIILIYCIGREHVANFQRNLHSW